MTIPTLFLQAVSSGDDAAVRFWDIERGEPLGEPLEGHLNYAYCVDAAQRADLVVSGSFDESMRLWDSRVRKCVRVIPCHSEPVTSVCFSSDGTFIVSSSSDGLIRCWDTASGHCLKTLHADGAPPV
jgi:COMPASS component SWD3